MFAFVLITAMATAAAAWYTRKQWESTADNGHRQLRAYVFPEQANSHVARSRKADRSGNRDQKQRPDTGLQTIKCDNDFREGFWTNVEKGAPAFGDP